MPEAQSDQPPSVIRSRRGAAALILLLVATAGLRSAVIGVRSERLSLDPDAYRLIAENLSEHGVYSRSQADAPIIPTAYRPPLYPTLLAALAWQGRVTPWSVATLHVVLGTLSVLLVWILAQKWRLGRWSYLTAIMVACDPILLNQSTEVMTETLATFLAVAGLLALTRFDHFPSGKSALLAGIVLGLATLCRPTFLVWTVLVAVRTVAHGERRLGVKHASLILVGFLVVLAPWVIRNQRAMGRPVLATTHGGYTLLLGNNPHFYDHLRRGRWTRVWDARELLPMLEQSAKRNTSGSLDEQQDAGQGGVEHREIVADRRLYELGKEAIREDPSMFAYASLVRFWRFWSPLPNRLSDNESPARTLARWTIAFWYTGVFMIALAGLFRLGRRAAAPPWVWGFLCVLAMTAVHTVFWSNMRMRAPAMPMVYLVLTPGCRSVYEWLLCCKVFRRRGL